jgi:hypothetical protein
MTQPPVTAFVLAQLRVLSDEARGLVRLAAGQEGESAIAEAKDRVVFECTGGPTHTWPEEWLG